MDGKVVCVMLIKEIHETFKSSRAMHNGRYNMHTCIRRKNLESIFRKPGDFP